MMRSKRGIWPIGTPFWRKSTLEELRACADTWLERMQKALARAGLSFTVPYRTENAEAGAIILEWWKVQPPARKLAVTLGKTVSYVRSEGKDQRALMQGNTDQVYTGKIADDDTFRLLWHWLGY